MYYQLLEKVKSTQSRVVVASVWSWRRRFVTCGFVLRKVGSVVETDDGGVVVRT